MLGGASILAGLAIAVAPVGATAAPQDISSTHAYIQANYALARAGVARIGPAEAAIGRLDAELGQKCPGEGAGSVEDEAAEPLSYEVAVAMVSLAYGTGTGPIRTFIAATKRLRWSNDRITRLAVRYANSLHAYATLPLPDLCADVAAWKASGFQVTPATTAQIDAREQGVDLEAIPASLLAPYERGGDARVLERTEALEIKIENTEFSVGQNEWYELLGTLGLMP